MAENLVGDEHVHDFSHPYRGHLMCSDDLCGAVRTTDGQHLSDDERNEIHSQILSDMGWPPEP